MFSTKVITEYRAASLMGMILIASLLSFACTEAGTGGDANLRNANSAANPPASSPDLAADLERPEPDRYSVTTTVTIQPTGNAPQANIAPLQFNFARMGPDSRVSFRLPDPVGEIIYLEKAPLKYLIFPSRNQYVELDPNELGFQLGHLMSPGAVVERLKQRGHYEKMGVETVNGRSAVKYRFT